MNSDSLKFTLTFDPLLYTSTKQPLSTTPETPKISVTEINETRKNKSENAVEGVTEDVINKTTTPASDNEKNSNLIYKFVLWIKSKLISIFKPHP